MAEKHYQVRVEPDHLRTLTSARPVAAVSELIWNALDADATRVDVEVDSDEFASHAITVRDNGDGIPHDEVEGLFGKLGGSWKAKGARSKRKKRILHGREGKGRFKALALGRVADWTVRYQSGGRFFRYKITLLRDDLIDVRVSDPEEVDPSLGTGVEVRVSELDRTYRSLTPAQANQPLSEIFALYLTTYTDASVFIEGERLDPSALIDSRQTFELSPIDDGDQTWPFELELIEWKTASERWIFLCGEEGFPFHRVAPQFHTSGHDFSAYLKSPLISDLQERGVLELAEMNPPLLAAYDISAGLIKDYFRDKDAKAAHSEIDRWKAEQVYPYQEEPKTPVEEAERKVFDIVALNVNRHLVDFAEGSRQTKAFQLRMLRQAIESGPDELQLILKEVLDLPEGKQKELAKLLEEADLANVISASKMVADRLKFLSGIEALLFDSESKKLLKERSQLHRMLADNNTWVFGEEFNLTVDDQSLTEVLRKHLHIVGRDTVVDNPVKRIDGKVGIVDLMLSRSVPQNHADEREHLVVELKRPSVKVGSDEITQIEKYAFTVAGDERFRHLRTRWSFWVISNDLDAFAVARTRQRDKPRGQIYQNDDGLITVWVKTWAEILSECKARLRFVEEQLRTNIDKESSLKYLKATYDKYLSGVITEGSPDSPDTSEPDAAA